MARGPPQRQADSPEDASAGRGNVLFQLSFLQEVDRFVAAAAPLGFHNRRQAFEEAMRGLWKEYGWTPGQGFTGSREAWRDPLQPTGAPSRRTGSRGPATSGKPD